MATLGVVSIRVPDDITIITLGTACCGPMRCDVLYFFVYFVQRELHQFK